MKEPRGPKKVPIPVKPSETITVHGYTQEYDEVSLQGIVNDIITFYSDKDNPITDINLSDIRISLDTEYDSYDSYSTSLMVVSYCREYTTKNINYNTQLTKYNKEVADYPEKLKVYEEKRVKYLIDLEAYKNNSYNEEKKRSIIAYEKAKKEWEKFQK